MTTPTPSTPTIPQTATTLGGSVVAFDKKYGASNCCFENGWDYQGPYGPMWTGVNTDHTPASNVDEGSPQRVISIENAGWTYSDLTLTVTQAKALCGSFLPSDAKLQHTITVSLGSVAAGSELRYSSTLLANTLPASDFTDRAGKAMSPGTIFVYYDYTYNGSSNPLVSDCALAADESLIVQLPSKR